MYVCVYIYIYMIKNHTRFWLKIHPVFCFFFICLLFFFVFLLKLWKKWLWTQPRRLVNFVHCGLTSCNVLSDLWSKSQKQLKLSLYYSKCVIIERGQYVNLALDHHVSLTNQSISYRWPEHTGYDTVIWFSTWDQAILNSVPIDEITRARLFSFDRPLQRSEHIFPIAFEELSRRGWNSPLLSLSPWQLLNKWKTHDYNWFSWTVVESAINRSDTYAVTARSRSGVLRFHQGRVLVREILASHH